MARAPATLEDIPEWDEDSPDWATAHELVAKRKKQGRSAELESFRVRRSEKGALKSKDGLKGIHRSGEMWRKPSKTSLKTIYYLPSCS